MNGQPVARLLDADRNREVAVVGAIWIDAPISTYLAAVRDIENFERGGGFKVTKRISDPARVEDFKELVLPPDDVADLKACRVGDCQIKISQNGLDRMRKEIDWARSDAQAQVEALIRRIAVEYVTAYRQGGNANLAVYRDGERPTFVAQEFQGLVDGMPELSEYVPDMRRFLLGYPKVSVPGLSSFFYWQEAEFGLKPTIRINHVAIQEHKDTAVVATKQLYASHYFWTALELRVLVRDAARGRGFWFVSSTRSRSDGLTGFVGSMIRGRVREAARDGLETGLSATKKTIEARAR